MSQRSLRVAAFVGSLLSAASAACQSQPAPAHPASPPPPAVPTASAPAAPAEPTTPAVVAGSPAPGAPAEPAAPPAPRPATLNDYAQPASWLCLPGHKGACDADQDATVIAANGTTKLESFARAKAPAIDCFYVYPTVSRDPGIVSTMNVAPEELRVIAVQFARFGQVCRQFAPLYRQFTLTALRARMSGQPMPAGDVDPRIGYNDVVDAWNYYLANHNKGRGVVLIGHSQGAGVLTQLIKNEIDGKPLQRQLVSALLLGTRLQVPVGKTVGGDFTSVPLCRSSKETHCAIAYATFRATAPPTATSLFGKSAGAGLEAACVNPAALGGGTGPAHAYFTGAGAIVEASSSVEWVKGKAITTPFVSVPGMLTAECQKNDVASYLAITVHGDPKSPRSAEIPGDVVVAGQVRSEWGLHLIDVNLFMGNLIQIVRDQTTTFLREKQRASIENDRELIGIARDHVTVRISGPQRRRALVCSCRPGEVRGSPPRGSFQATRGRLRDDVCVRATVLGRRTDQAREPVHARRACS